MTDERLPKLERGKPIEGRRVLESLPSAARTTGEEAAARSQMVRRLRIALPILALVLVGTFLVNTSSNEADQSFLDDFKEITATTEDLRMANPSFGGIDNSGRPFDITANAAIRSPNEDTRVELENPRAVQGTGDEESVVTAAKGVYDETENILTLTDDVTLKHVFGRDVYILRSPEAVVSIKDEVVETVSGVGGESSDGGALQAETMRAYKDTNRVVFEGNVRMRIYPKSYAANDNEDVSDDASGNTDLEKIQ